MSKAANIYWDNSQPRSTTVRRTAKSRGPVTRTRRRAPWWLSSLIVTSIFVMLIISINFRAFTEMQEEAGQNTRLATQIQSLTDENLALQEEIHTLKTNPEIIQREAKRIGVDLKTVVSSQ